MSLTLPHRSLTALSRSERLSRWILAHRAQLALAGGVALLALVLGVSITLNRRLLLERAGDQISQARGLAAQRKNKEALDVLNAMLNVNRSGDAAMQAYVMKGEILFSDGKIPEAGAVYDEALTQASNPAYRALFLVGRASAAVAQQKWDPAADALQQFLKEFPEHLLVPRSYMELGRVRMAQQRWTDAQAAFERLVTLYPKSVWVAEAQSSLAQLHSLTAAAPAAPAAPPTKK